MHILIIVYVCDCNIHVYERCKNQNIKPLRDFLAKSRGYKDWTEFRAVATARQNRAVAFDRVYDEED